MGELYDVGMSSMVAMELLALANLARTAFDPPRAKDAELLTARANEMQALIQEHLWDDANGAFVNKFSTNASFYRRISPTSFYPLLARAATDDQAERIVKSWLTNRSRFCVSPEGDFVGNSDTCYWGLPSIAADDVAYPPLGYWRGYVWGPMAQLTYWALDEYHHLPSVDAARRALTKQMTAMGVNQWRLHRHVCENYNPHKDGADCTGDRFYHWGGLTGFLSVLDAGFYHAP